jgi:sec-independent protein translocase protein TatB
VFNTSGTELLIIVFIALVILGPERLPEAARKLGGALRELRKVQSGFQAEVREAFAEPIKAVKEPLDELRKGANDVRRSVIDTMNEAAKTADPKVAEAEVKAEAAAKAEAAKRPSAAALAAASGAGAPTPSPFEAPTGLPVSVEPPTAPAAEAS